MAGTVFGLYATYLALAFGIRPFVHRRLTGRSGWVRAAGPVDQAAESVVALGVLGTLATPILDLLDVVEPIAALDVAVAHAIGVAVGVAGLVVSVVTQIQMGASWKAGVEPEQRTELVTTGLFAVVRNPFYVGMMSLSIGVFLAVPSVVGLVSLLAVVAGCEGVVRLVEEPYLVTIHGREFASYRRQTGRFVPGLGEG